MKPLDLISITAIREAVKAVDPDDDDLLLGMIEGETDAGELLDGLLEREAATTAYIAANKERIKEIQARIARLEARVEAYRGGMQKVLDATGLRKMERASATVSIRAVPPKVLGGSIDGLPKECLIVNYAVNRRAVKEALESGWELEGWSLSNGGETISIRRS